MKTIISLGALLALFVSICVGDQEPQARYLRDCGIVETPWGLKQCFDRMQPKEFAIPNLPKKRKGGETSGQVVVAAYVGKDGKVIDVAVMTSCGDAAFDKALAATVKKFVYWTWKRDGVSEEFVTLQPMKFGQHDLPRQ